MPTQTSRRTRISARTDEGATSRRWSIGGHCSYRNGVFELRVTSPCLMKAYTSDDETPEFALVDEDNILLICYRMTKSESWSAADLRWPGESRDANGLPTHGAIEHRGHLAFLTPGEDGREEAMNYTLSLDFTRALFSAMREHMSNRRDPSVNARTIASLVDRFPSLTALVSKAGVRSIGNP